MRYSNGVFQTYLGSTFGLRRGFGERFSTNGFRWIVLNKEQNQKWIGSETEIVLNTEIRKKQSSFMVGTLCPNTPNPPAWQPEGHLFYFTFSYNESASLYNTPVQYMYPICNALHVLYVNASLYDTHRQNESASLNSTPVQYSTHLVYTCSTYNEADSLYIYPMDNESCLLYSTQVYSNYQLVYTCSVNK